MTLNVDDERPDRQTLLVVHDAYREVAVRVADCVWHGCGTTAAEVTFSLVKLAGGGVLWGLMMAVMTYHFVKHSGAGPHNMEYPPKRWP